MLSVISDLDKKKMCIEHPVQQCNLLVTRSTSTKATLHGDILVIQITRDQFNSFKKDNLLRLFANTVVKFNSMITNKPHQVPKIWICCFVSDETKHVLISNCNKMQHIKINQFLDYQLLLDASCDICINSLFHSSLKFYGNKFEIEEIKIRLKLNHYICMKHKERRAQWHEQLPLNTSA